MTENLGETKTFRTGKENIGKRIDVYLSELPEIKSRSQAQKLIEQHKIKINGTPVSKSYVLSDDMLVEVEISVCKPKNTLPENIPLNIIFEDDSILVISKPAGLVVHPAPGHQSNTLVNGILYYLQKKKIDIIPPRAGIIHRLDKDTSGLLVIGKTIDAQRKLIAELKKRKIKRTYLTLVKGHFSKKRGKIDAPVGRSLRDRKKMSVTGTHSRQAVTYFKVLKEIGDYSLVEVDLETGRTHQIRVHFAFINRPIAGDKTYGSKTKGDIANLGRQFLHACQLELEHPVTGEKIIFKDDLPKDLNQALLQLQDDAAARSSR